MNRGGVKKMALKDNTETLEQILEDVYALPNRSSGASVDATITLIPHYDATPLNLVAGSFEYNESEIVNVANKVQKEEDVNVKVYGQYNFWSGSGYYGNFSVSQISFDWYTKELRICFDIDYNGKFVKYCLMFELNTNDGVAIGVSGFKLTRASKQADAIIELYTINDSSTGVFTVNDVVYYDHEIINAWNKTLLTIDVDIKIVGNYWSEGYGTCYRTFVPLMYEAKETGDNEGTLEVVFMIKQDTGLEEMKITFTIGADSTVTHNVTTNN